MKYHYVALAVEENGKFYAYTIKVSESDNLLSKLSIKGIIHANLYPKKKAEETVNRWNEAYKLNGKYMFDCPSF